MAGLKLSLNKENPAGKFLLLTEKVPFHAVDKVLTYLDYTTASD